MTDWRNVMFFIYKRQLLKQRNPPLTHCLKVYYKTIVFLDSYTHLLSRLAQNQPEFPEMYIVMKEYDLKTR